MATAYVIPITRLASFSHLLSGVAPGTPRSKELHPPYMLPRSLHALLLSSSSEVCNMSLTECLKVAHLFASVNRPFDVHREHWRTPFFARLGDKLTDKGVASSLSIFDLAEFATMFVTVGYRHVGFFDMARQALGCVVADASASAPPFSDAAAIASPVGNAALQKLIVALHEAHAFTASDEPAADLSLAMAALLQHNVQTIPFQNPLCLLPCFLALAAATFRRCVRPKEKRTQRLAEPCAPHCWATLRAFARAASACISTDAHALTVSPAIKSILSPTLQLALPRKPAALCGAASGPPYDDRALLSSLLYISLRLAGAVAPTYETPATKRDVTGVLSTQFSSHSRDLLYKCHLGAAEESSFSARRFVSLLPPAYRHCAPTIHRSIDGLAAPMLDNKIVLPLYPESLLDLRGAHASESMAVEGALDEVGTDGSRSGIDRLPCGVVDAKSLSACEPPRWPVDSSVHRAVRGLRPVAPGILHPHLRPHVVPRGSTCAMIEFFSCQLPVQLVPSPSVAFDDAALRRDDAELDLSEEG